MVDVGRKDSSKGIEEVERGEEAEGKMWYSLPRLGVGQGATCVCSLSLMHRSTSSLRNPIWAMQPQIRAWLSIGGGAHSPESDGYPGPYGIQPYPGPYVCREREPRGVCR